MIQAEKNSFVENCQLLGLKKIACDYHELIQKAGQQNIGFYEFLEQMIEIEANNKMERRIAYRIKQSKLPQPLKLLADFDFSFQPGLSKRLIMDLATLNFIKAQESILFIGDCGTGKSYLAQSLALIACQKDYRVFYTTCANLISDLNTAAYEKTLAKRLRKYAAPDLLVIDEMGHERPEPQVTKEAQLLFKVINERYTKKAPVIFTSNVQQQDWAEYLGDPISTRAILDRIAHRSIKIKIHGPSYREFKGRKLQEKYNIPLTSPQKIVEQALPNYQ
jgi:DNA replication protein DnaC